MLIDVKSLAENNILDFEFDDKLTVDYSGSNMGCQAHILGSVSKVGEDYIIKAETEAVLNLNCDLCLSAFETRLVFELNEVYSSSPDLEKEFWELSDKTIDLKPAVKAAIILNMPMRNVCSENCKGLCPVCGHNLNEGDCGCVGDYVNPQFEKLLTLFND